MPSKRPDSKSSSPQEKTDSTAATTTVAFAKSDSEQVEKRSCSKCTSKPINVVIETDIGHDCDDIECLQIALKDHKVGRIRIRYISTVSCNNASRARVVQHLCACFGISDIPIIPSLREQASRDGERLTRCTPVWMYERVGNQYQSNPAKARVEDVHGSHAKLCPIYPPAHSVAQKQHILRQCVNVRVLVIGPGIEAETFTKLVQSPDGTRSIDRKLRGHIDRIVWQGNYDDKASFNIACDYEPAKALQTWAFKHGIPTFNIGKLVAYNTQLDMEAFRRLASCAKHRRNSFDLQAHWQLGVMEFRDGNRNLFNCLNFGVSCPGKRPAGRSAEAFDAANPRHAALAPLLTSDSLQTAWFEAMKTVPPMYDITAYILLRDAHLIEGSNMTLKKFPQTASNGSTRTQITSAETWDSYASFQCELYKITQDAPFRYSVGASAPDIKLCQTEYLRCIERELHQAMDVLESDAPATAECTSGDSPQSRVSCVALGFRQPDFDAIVSAHQKSTSSGAVLSAV